MMQCEARVVKAEGGWESRGWVSRWRVMGMGLIGWERASRPARSLAGSPSARSQEIFLRAMDYQYVWKQ